MFSGFSSFFLQVFQRKNFILLISLLAMLVLVIPGLTWGTYKCMNLDQVAFLNVTAPKRPYLHPGHFDKPIFMAYLNHFLVIVPCGILQKPFVFLGFNKDKVAEMGSRLALIAARLLQYAFFVMLLVLAFRLCGEFFGPPAATATAILLGTCAGMLPYVLFLTADMPMLAWMMGCLFCCCVIIKKPSLAASLLAGACAGIAFATKYNGLLVAPMIILAHLLAPSSRPFRDTLRRPSFYAGCFVVPIIFMLVNPYSVLDWKGFINDFHYAYAVTPVYNGQKGFGYLAFLKAFQEIFGPILGWLLLPLFGVSVWRIFAKQLPSLSVRVWFLLLAFFALYFWKIGSFPRIETRFILPVAPVVLLLIAPAWEVTVRARPLFIVLLAVIGIYGFVCGIFITESFHNDPRQAAVRWAERNFPDNITVERSGGSPDWQYMVTHHIKSIRIPEGFDRKKLFETMFANKASMQEALKRNVTSQDLAWFSDAAQAKRGTAFISFSTVDMTDSQMQNYYETLLSGSAGFQMVFDAMSPPLPKWVYPQKTEFLRNRFTIFQKQG